MPTRQARRLAKNSSTLPRRSCLVMSVLPWASMPCTWNTDLARSRPIVVTYMRGVSWCCRLRHELTLQTQPGRGTCFHHDYIRNGITTLFAALNVLDGTVLGRCMQRHRHQEFIRFLNTVEAAVPAGKLIHAILDNYGSHKHPKVRAWLARHPRWTFHYTPTSGSWLNAVETFFSTLTRRRLKRGVFRSIVELQAAIKSYLAEHNQAPRPFTWIRSADAILDRLAPIPAPSV